MQQAWLMFKIVHSAFTIHFTMVKKIVSFQLSIKILLVVVPNKLEWVQFQAMTDFFVVNKISKTDGHQCLVVLAIGRCITYLKSQASRVYQILLKSAILGGKEGLVATRVVTTSSI